MIHTFGEVRIVSANSACDIANPARKATTSRFRILIAERSVFIRDVDIALTDVRSRSRRVVRYMNVQETSAG